MNKVQIYGRVAFKSVLRQTGNGTDVINLSIATGYGESVTFLPVTLWDRQAVIVNDFVSVGHRLLVEGHITENKFVKDGIGFTDHIVTADFVHLVETKKDKHEGLTPEDFIEPEESDNSYEAAFNGEVT